MAKDLDTYLKELQAVLTDAGADPALVQDALFDAEEHLRTEIAERYQGQPSSMEEQQTRFAAVMEDYGTPDEVAAAYLAPAVPVDAPAAEVQESLSQSADHPGASVETTDLVAAIGAAAGMAAAPKRPSALRRVFGVVVDPSVYKALLYMLLSLATGIFYFTVVVTGVSMTAGMIVLIIGIPLFLLVLAMVRGMALVEGRLVEVLLGTRMPRRDRADLPEAGWLKRIGFWLKDGRTWASMGYMILMLPLGTAYFTIAVTGLGVAAGLIGSPFGHWAHDHVFTWQGSEHVFGIPTWASPLAMIGGFVLLLLWLHVIRWIGRGHAAFAKHMLVRLSSD